METDAQKPLRIAVVAGEPSGDRQGAALVEALRAAARPRPVEAWGIGGHFLRAAGLALRHDSDPWAAIGIAETLTKIPAMLWVLWDMKRALKRDPPDALVLVDAGAFNVPLARWVKAQRICPIFYFFPPGSWRRQGKAGGAEGLAAATDRIVTPFPWSEALLRAGGADAHFVGHPLLDLVKPSLEDSAFYGRYGLDPARPIVALLPGSRRGEIRHILPALVGAAGEITRRIPSVQFVLALSSSAARAQVESLIRREQRRGGRAARVQLLMSQAGDKLAQIAHTTLPTPVPVLATDAGLLLPADLTEPVDSGVHAHPAPGPAPLVIAEGLTWDVLARSDLVLTKSGTATLEAMILKKPMVIVYRGSKLMALEYRLRRRSHGIVHLGMPNILAGERLFAELLGDEATPDAIAALAVELLLEPGRILTLKQRLADLARESLGEPGGVARSADLLLEMIAGWDGGHG